MSIPLILILLQGVPQGFVLGPLLLSVCPDVECQLYADDAVIYVHGCSSEVVASKLTRAMSHITKWLCQSCLGYVNKTIGMFFSKWSHLRDLYYVIWASLNI